MANKNDKRNSRNAMLKALVKDIFANYGYLMSKIWKASSDYDSIEKVGDALTRWASSTNMKLDDKAVNIVTGAIKVFAPYWKGLNSFFTRMNKTYDQWSYETNRDLTAKVEAWRKQVKAYRKQKLEDIKIRTKVAISNLPSKINKYSRGITLPKKGSTNKPKTTRKKDSIRYPTNDNAMHDVYMSYTNSVKQGKAHPLSYEKFSDMMRTGRLNDWLKTSEWGTIYGISEGEYNEQIRKEKQQKGKEALEQFEQKYPFGRFP